MTPREVLSVSPIIPVIRLERVEDAVPLAQALLAGGIGVMEITLRTEAGLPSIQAVANAVPEMLVGAGTVLSPQQFDEVCQAGAQFAISPGFTPELLQHASQSPVPLIPGVGTASEIMTAMRYGYDTFKLFPANIVGGVAALKSFAGPFGGVAFCPTGGVNVENLSEYLQLDNVLCVGGTWLTSQAWINDQAFDRIQQTCEEALSRISGI